MRVTHVPEYMLGEFQRRSFEQNCLLCNIFYLYYKRNRKTRLVRLWCDNALGECWEKTREACKG
jgi:hypothetical protein